MLSEIGATLTDGTEGALARIGIVILALWFGANGAIYLFGPQWAKDDLLFFSLVVGAIALGVIWGRGALENRRIARKKLYPPFDPGAGNPNVAAGAELLMKQDWSGLSARYRKQTPSDRYAFIDALGKTAVVDTPLPSDQSDSGALTICGGLKVTHAWRFRGSAQRITDVGRMIGSLGDAQQALLSALIINPLDSTALAFMIRAEMGARGDKGFLAEILQRARQSFEANIFIAANHLQFVSAKWHGSTKEMWGAAEYWTSNGPNAAWLGIAARAHIEEWLHAVAFERTRRKAMSAKLRSASFQQQVSELDDAFWRKIETQPIAGAEASFAHNNFAFLLHKLKSERVKRHLEAIGPYITQSPWEYNAIGALEPMHVLANVRKAYGMAPLSKSGIAR